MCTLIVSRVILWSLECNIHDIAYYIIRMFHETMNDMHFDATHENYVRKYYAFLALNSKMWEDYLSKIGS